MRFTQALCGFVLALVAAAAHADFAGKVVRVLDGDTIEVLVDRHPVRVRLAEIDAPEKAQPFGARSKDELASLVAGRHVDVIDLGLDFRGARTVGAVLVGKTNVNAAMVDAGMAWAYRPYLRSRALLDAEADARGAHRGLWADPRPMAPWEWRRRSRD